LIPANKEIKAIPEQSKKSTEPKKQAIPEQKKLHTMSQKEKFFARGRELGEAAMEKANKNMIQKIEQPNINLEKYSPLINSPCIGCVNSCIPESCTSLTNYIMG